MQSALRPSIGAFLSSTFALCAYGLLSQQAGAAPGYRGGQSLPTSVAVTINASDYGVIADDGQDDAVALQSIIDNQIILTNSASNLVVIQLPAGELHLNDEVHVDRSGVIIKGAGNDPATGTKITVRSWAPYGVGSSNEPTLDGKYWPGFAAFRAETRLMHPNEPAYEGSVNFHWKHSIEVAQPANQGDTVLHLSSGGASQFSVGDIIYVGAASDTQFLDYGGVPNFRRSESSVTTGHMRTQLFNVVAVNVGNNTVTIDQPLEFDVPLQGESGYDSRVMPVTVVEDVGFRDFYMTLDPIGTDCASYNAGDYDVSSNPYGVGHRYENLCPADAIHGILFKYALNSWVDNVSLVMTGSHPIVTEFAKNMTFSNNDIDGAWNKGAGGNGYFRGSKLYDSLIKGNHIQNIRHLAIQWSATGNLVENNTLNCDLNLHGGWERHNVIRNNVISVPYEHQNWSNGGPDGGTWQPIWYGAAEHATKWSGPTGPNNVFVDNILEKALTAGAPISRWGLYDTPGVEYAFAWDGSDYQHVNVNGVDVTTWDQQYAEDVYLQMPTSGVHVTGSTDPYDPPDNGGNDGNDGNDSGDNSCTETLDIVWKDKTEITLGSATCIRFDRELSNKTNQFWDSDANPSCNFRGSVTSVDGGGSIDITGNYHATGNLTGSTLLLHSTNGCAFIKVRAY